MNSLHRSDTQPSSYHDRLQPWWALPRLLVSRRWRWVTLIVVLLAFGLFRLGMWQLDRLTQRREVNARIAARVNAPPVELTGQPLDLEEYEYRPVIVRGEYDLSQQITIRNRILNGVPGADILTPLRITGSDQSVLVNRGWVPLEQAHHESLEQFAVNGPVSITGIIRKPRTREGGLMPVDQQPQRGRLDVWFRPDVAKIAQQVPYPLLPFYVEQTPTSDSMDLPLPHSTVDYRSEGSHLGYALQWFAFTAILLGGYAALVVTRSTARDSGDDE